MRVLLYYHGGSDNRGCEAIVRTTAKILKKSCCLSTIDVFSANPEEDKEVNLDSVVNISKNPIRSIPELPIYLRAVAKLYNKAFHTEKLYYIMTDKPFREYDFRDAIAVHIGGDHYCYEGTEALALHNLEVKKNGGISVLWGCSVEPSFLSKQKVVEDLKRYDLITARESITYDALKKAGINNIDLYPDPAFILGYKENKLSELIGNNMVGINISPYAMGDSDIGLKNYVCLINWIINNTDMNICLIPHVFKSHSNDSVTNKMLHDKIRKTDKVSMITEKLTAEELKAVIRKCRFFIGARTHSTIAAYSSCVPTLVLGYSVKAKGIAKDIFGTYENYVVSVQNLRQENELQKCFQWMIKNETSIREHLQSMMPTYIGRAHEAGARIREISKEKLGK